LQHHQIDEAGDTGLARGNGHRRGGVEQAVLHRIGKIDRRGSLHRALDRADVEKIALKDFGAERAKMLGALVDLVDESADRNPAREQHFGYVPPSLALPAAGRGRDENWSCHLVLPLHSALYGYHAVPMALNVWYQLVPNQGKDGDAIDHKTACGKCR
jgi:hypothetical protein